MASHPKRARSSGVENFCSLQNSSIMPRREYIKWALLGLNQRPLACESDLGPLAGIGLRCRMLVNVRHLNPFLCRETCADIVEIVSCCLVSGNNLGSMVEI